MSLEALLERVAVAVERNTESVEKLCAGREAALAQFDKKAAELGDKPATTRTRKKADPVVAVGGTEVISDAVVAEPVATVTVTDDDLRAAAQSYIGGAGEDVKARQARGANLKAILNHFGVAQLVGPSGVQEPEQKQQALFYVQRYAAGHGVDFSQDYDFAGDPAQGAAAVEASEDEFAIG